MKKVEENYTTQGIALGPSKASSSALRFASQKWPTQRNYEEHMPILAGHI